MGNPTTSSTTPSVTSASTLPAAPAMETPGMGRLLPAIVAMPKQPRQVRHRSSQASRNHERQIETGAPHPPVRPLGTPRRMARPRGKSRLTVHASNIGRCVPRSRCSTSCREGGPSRNRRNRLPPQSFSLPGSNFPRERSNDEAHRYGLPTGPRFQPCRSSANTTAATGRSVGGRVSGGLEARVSMDAGAVRGCLCEDPRGPKELTPSCGIGRSRFATLRCNRVSWTIGIIPC